MSSTTVTPSTQTPVTRCTVVTMKDDAIASTSTADSITTFVASPTNTTSDPNIRSVGATTPSTPSMDISTTITETVPRVLSRIIKRYRVVPGWWQGNTPRKEGANVLSPPEPVAPPPPIRSTVRLWMVNDNNVDSSTPNVVQEVCQRWVYRSRPDHSILQKDSSATSGNKSSPSSKCHEKIVSYNTESSVRVQLWEDTTVPSTAMLVDLHPTDSQSSSPPDMKTTGDDSSSVAIVVDSVEEEDSRHNSPSHTWLEQGSDNNNNDDLTSKCDVVVWCVTVHASSSWTVDSANRSILRYTQNRTKMIDNSTTTTPQQQPSRLVLLLVSDTSSCGGVVQQELSDTLTTYLDQNTNVAAWYHVSLPLSLSTDCWFRNDNQLDLMDTSQLDDCFHAIVRDVLSARDNGIIRDSARKVSAVDEPVTDVPSPCGLETTALLSEPQGTDETLRRRSKRRNSSISTDHTVDTTAVTATESVVLATASKKRMKSSTTTPVKVTPHPNDTRRRSILS